jgi:hypothetical protein
VDDWHACALLSDHSFVIGPGPSRLGRPASGSRVASQNRGWADAQHHLARALWDAPAERPHPPPSSRRPVADDLASATELEQWLTDHPLAAP